MSRHAPCLGRSAIAVAVLLILLTSPLTRRSVRAHDRKEVGTLRLVIGWGDEPAFSGLKNAVEVDVTDTSGKPVSDVDGALSVNVSFGDQRVVLPLRPARGQPGKYRSVLLPTRSGTYAFHVVGTLKGQAIDITSVCSEQTFACVTDVADIQFPVKDPSTGEVADRLGREIPRTEAAREAAASGRTISLSALAVSALAVVIATVRRRNR